MNGAGELVMGLVICAMVVAASNWEIEIHFHQYSNPNGTRNRIPQCCAANCVCEVEFKICLRPGDYDSEDKRCPYNDFEKTTSMYTVANFITFNDTINDLENPILFSSGGELKEVPTNGLSLFVRVRDMGSIANMLVDRVFAFIKGIGSSANSTLLTGEFGNVELIISHDVHCQQDYYANDCSTHCLPSDNSTGHYNCDPSNGNKICLPGYQNPQTNCTQVACELVCTGEGGSCSESGECVCSQGWGGEDCGQAQCAENCHPVGGYCDQPRECLCNGNWTGTNCDQFLCHPNCSPVGGTCVMAGGCDCLPDYTGEYCETYSLPIGAIIGGTIGVVVFVTLLLLAIVSVLVLLIRRRAGKKFELPGSGDTGGNPEENVYTLSSDKPMSGMENSMYDSKVSIQQRQPAASDELVKVDNVSSSVPAPYESFVPTGCKPAHLDHFSATANEEEAGEEPFERVVDNDLYALSTPGEGDQSMATGLQAQSSNGYAYVTWHTKHH